jgi:hypothetical protein
MRTSEAVALAMRSAEAAEERQNHVVGNKQAGTDCGENTKNLKKLSH